MNNKKVSNKKEPFSAPKGTRDIIGDDYYLYQGFFEKAQEISLYYGFKPIETPILEHEEVFTSSIGEGTDIIDKEMYTLKTKGGDHLAMRPEHTAGLVRAYIEHGMQNVPQPVLFYHYGPVFRHDNPQKGRYRQFWQFDMDALGSEKSIVDALVIKTTIAILEEAGAHNLSVDINSIGDKECRNGYIKELINYYKKHLEDLPAVDRERFKNNPISFLFSGNHCWNFQSPWHRRWQSRPLGFRCDYWRIDWTSRGQTTHSFRMGQKRALFYPHYFLRG